MCCDPSWFLEASTIEGDEYAFEVTQVEWSTNCTRRYVIGITTAHCMSGAEIPKKSRRFSLFFPEVGVELVLVAEDIKGAKYISNTVDIAMAAATHTMGVSVNINRTMTPAK